MRLLRLARQLVLNKLSSAPPATSSTEVALYGSSSGVTMRTSAGSYDLLTALAGSFIRLTKITS